MGTILHIMGLTRPDHGFRQINQITCWALMAASILWGSSALAQEEETTEGQIEEIIVTASKMGAVSVQDIPMSVSAIDEALLSAMGANEFEDFYRFAPGLNVQDGGPGLKTYIIRGVSLAGSIPAVGQYYDEWLTPVGTAIGAVAGVQFDPKVVDVNRVEVLKGPQGTLYGASAMAGIVRIISNKPDVTGWDYMLETDLSSTQEGGDNFGLKGMINVPLSEDRVAFRAAAYYYDNSGFIDNVVTDEENINDEETYGARASLLWTPTSNVTIQANAAVQNSDLGSEQKVMVNLPASDGFDYGAFGETFGIQDIAPTRGTGDIDDYETQKYVSDQRHDDWWGVSLRADVASRWFDFTGIGTFSERDYSEDEDFWNLTFWHGPGSIRRVLEISETTTFEARFRSNWDKRVNWLVGLYSEKFTTGKPGSFFNNGMNANGSIWDFQRQACVDAFAANGVAGVPETQTPAFDFACEVVMGTIDPAGAAPNFFSLVGKPRLGCTPGNEKGLLPTCSDFHRIQGERDREQTAVFAEISYDFSDKLRAAYGIRFYELKQEVFGDDVVFNLFGTDGAGNPFFFVPNTPKSSAPDEDDVIHRFDLSYHVSDDIMAFAHFGQGYRQGGENLESPFVTFPLTFDTDTTDNYEIGLKTLLFDKSFLLNVSAYFIEIGDIQERVFKCGAVVCAGFIDNVGNAESKGIELETVLRTPGGWTFSGSLSWGESKLTEDSQAAVGVPSGGILPNPGAGHKGDRLPNTPEVTGAVNVTYEGDIDFAGIDLPMFANLQWWYVGESFTEFNDNDPLNHINASYTETRLRVGFQGERLGVTFYVNNVFDQVNDLGSRSRVFTSIRETTVNRPRTIGVTFQVRK